MGRKIKQRKRSGAQQFKAVTFQIGWWGSLTEKMTLEQRHREASPGHT